MSKLKKPKKASKTNFLSLDDNDENSLSMYGGLCHDYHFKGHGFNSRRAPITKTSS